MPSLTWDDVGERVYETGLDRGVLYLPDGSAVPWNGLTSVIEKLNNESSPVYYDGMKINDLVVLGDFEASLKALTYPEDLNEIEGMAPARRGFYYGNQPTQVFGLCYRTGIGNDVDSEIGYKIHIVYNVTVNPKDKSYETNSDSPAPTEFEWELTAAPEEIPGFRPTAHVVINSRDLDPWLLEELEEMLYGSSTATAALIPLEDLSTYVNEWFRIQITDNGDGTWTAYSPRDGLIETEGVEQLFTINQANVVYLDDYTYTISDTTDIAEST